MRHPSTQLSLLDALDRPRVLKREELVVVFDRDDSLVLSGTYNEYGFTAQEWQTYLRKLERAGGV